MAGAMLLVLRVSPKKLITVGPGLVVEKIERVIQIRSGTGSHSLCVDVPAPWGDCAIGDEEINSRMQRQRQWVDEEFERLQHFLSGADMGAALGKVFEFSPDLPELEAEAKRDGDGGAAVSDPPAVPETPPCAH